jgi:hypothetical protein
MAINSFSEPVEESVSKVNNEIEVGEDLGFQRRWWRFEKFVWVIFSLIIVLDLCGVFGRGPFAKAERRAADGTVDVKYERVERTESPSILTIHFGQSAIVDGKIKLYISESLVDGLGTERIIPAPLASEVGKGGLTYTFLASKPPASVALALEPSGPGLYEFTLGVVGAEPVHAKVFVVP